MAFKARKIEHSGSKKGRGAYWGRKVDAKRESNRKRREDTRAIVRDARLQAEKGSKAEKCSRNP
jgi:predicted aminopeptidase